MIYQAIATDFDGTIATGGKVAPETYLALQRWQQTGRSLIMVTGRGLNSLYGVFPEARTFDRGMRSTQAPSFYGGVTLTVSSLRMEPCCIFPVQNKRFY